MAEAPSGADRAQERPPSIASLLQRYGSRTPEEILAHPRFQEARALYLREMMGLYDHGPELNRVLIEAGRHIMFGLIACMHAGYDPLDRSTWVTLKRLKQELAAFSLVSPRSIDAIVGRLVARGFLVLKPAPTDRRLRLLEPTERLDAHNHAVIVAYVTPLRILFDDPRYRRLLSGDAAFLQAQRMSAISTFGWWAQIITQNREMMHFLPRPSGIIILFKFIASEMQRSDGSGQPETFAEIGHRFGVSRSHVRNLVIEAEEAGLMERVAGDERHVRITPRCAAAFDRFVADTLSSSDLAVCMADHHLREAAAA